MAGCMIAGHRTTGTDQSGMVSGLMTLENRRSFRDLPAGTMTVPDLVDMCRAGHWLWDEDPVSLTKYPGDASTQIDWSPGWYFPAGHETVVDPSGLAIWPGEAIRILTTLILTGTVQAGMV